MLALGIAALAGLALYSLMNRRRACTSGASMLVVVCVDRLGRNYADVTETIRELIRQGVTVRTVISTSMPCLRAAMAGFSPA